MNRKKKIFTIFFAAFLMISGKAQIPFSYNNSTKNFSITTPAIKSSGKGTQAPFKQATIPFTRVFLETGNGAFFTFTTNTNDGIPGNQIKTFLQNWYFSPTKPVQQPLVQLNTYYDTTRIPPMTTSIANFNPQRSTSTNPPSQIPLAAHEFLRITPSTSTVIPGDMMTIALTYKNSSNEIPSYNKSLLVFYYNGLENPNIFYSVPVGTGAVPYQFGGVSVPALRKHNNESILSDAQIAQLPGALISKLNTMNPGYGRAIYISVPYDPSINERNVFLSLSPNTDTLAYTSELSSVKAVLVDYNCFDNPNTCGSNFTELLQPFNIDFASRDPNNIFTTPNCFNCNSSLFATSSACSTTYKNKPIDYTVQFENIGAGMAKKIVVTVSIPKGIKFPTLAETTNLFSCKIGETDIGIYRQGGPVFVQEKNSRYCLYRLDPESNQIIFTIINANLAGIVVSDGKNRVRSGEIKFKLKTVSNLISFPDCMQSKVSILFDGNRPELGSSIIRINCNNAICPPTYIDPHAGK